MQAPEPNIDDEELLILLRGERTREQGFRFLMQRYQERLYLHIRRLVGQHQDADDVLQNCLVKVYRNIDRFRGQSALYTWLYRIATNESMTFLRKRQRHTSRLAAGDEAGAAELRSSGRALDGDALQKQLRRAMETLPDRQRQVFVMRYYDELSYNEIAEILKTSVGGLKASYHHAVKKIERYLTDKIIS